MKKEALVSALLLANPALALAGGALAEARSEALRARADLVESTFASTTTGKATLWVKDAATGQYVSKETEVFYRVSFLPAGAKGNDYEYDGEGEMDYEMLVELVDVATGESNGVDNTFYVKKEGGSKLKVYDCDSTKRCTEGFGEAKAYVFTTDDGLQGLKIRNKAEALPDLPETDVVFFEVKK